MKILRYLGIRGLLAAAIWSLSGCDGGRSDVDRELTEEEINAVREKVNAEKRKESEEEEAWLAATKANTDSAYRQFLEDYPDPEGKHFREADSNRKRKEAEHQQMVLEEQTILDKLKQDQAETWRRIDDIIHKSAPREERLTSDDQPLLARVSTHERASEYSAAMLYYKKALNEKLKEASHHFGQLSSSSASEEHKEKHRRRLIEATKPGFYDIPLTYWPDLPDWPQRVGSTPVKDLFETLYRKPVLEYLKEVPGHLDQYERLKPKIAVQEKKLAELSNTQ